MGHWDYRKPGELQVHIFQDRVEIVNPGGLVGGLTLETLGTRSIPRNPLLFGMMHRMNLVEKVGSGLLRIRQMCESYRVHSRVLRRTQTGTGLFSAGKRLRSQLLPIKSGPSRGQSQKLLSLF